MKRVITFLCTALVAFAHIRVIAQEPIPTESFTSETDYQIAFTSGIEGIEDVYLISLDGSAPINLTNRGDASYPAWSPDGSRFAFVGYREGNNEIYIANHDGSNQINLTNNNAHDQFPAWSPDGHSIAFTSYRDGNWEVYVMNSDGTNPTNLTNHSAADGEWGLSWSPDGRKIAFTSNRDAPFNTDSYWATDIYAMEVDTLEVTRLIDDSTYSDGHPSFTDGYPTWSPDGNNIVFVSDRSLVNRWWQIYIMDADGSNVRSLTNQNSNIRYLYESPTWSPDGDKIAFTACAEHLQNCEIYMMNADGSEIIQLTNDNDADLQPAWRP
jgi:TolB protein